MSDAGWPETDFGSGPFPDVEQPQASQYDAAADEGRTPWDNCDGDQHACQNHLFMGLLRPHDFPSKSCVVYIVGTPSAGSNDVRDADAACDDAA